jgi:hypothetical protein
MLDLRVLGVQLFRFIQLPESGGRVSLLKVASAQSKVVRCFLDRFGVRGAAREERESGEQEKKKSPSSHVHHLAARFLPAQIRILREY